MKRYAILTMIAAACCAQPTREQYRAPYQAWRQAAPGLEQDAAAPAPAFAEQVRVSQEGAQKYFTERSAYLAGAQPAAVAQTAWASKPLATAEVLLATPANVNQLLAARAAKVTSDLSAFRADDKDAAIRRLRQAMERERAALRALTDSLAAHKAPLTELTDATDDAEIARASAFQALNAAGGRRTQIAEHVKREATDWSTYYKDLSEGAGARNVSSATAAGPGASPAKILRPNPNQIPLTRYVGDWVFPNKGLYYGPQPESVEMTIRESGGNISGTLSARFTGPARTIKFDFQGAIQQAKSQTFPLQTSDGATGTVELIPGTAFNLLEVNFQAAGAVGNLILLKK